MNESTVSQYTCTHSPNITPYRKRNSLLSGRPLLIPSVCPFYRWLGIIQVLSLHSQPAPVTWSARSHPKVASRFSPPRIDANTRRPTPPCERRDTSTKATLPPFTERCPTHSGIYIKGGDTHTERF